MKKLPFLILILFLLNNYFFKVCNVQNNIDKMYVMYEGEKIIVRTIEEKDIKDYVKMLNDKENVKSIYTGKPWGEEKVAKKCKIYIERWGEKNKDEGNPLSALTIIEKKSSNFLGFVLLGPGPHNNKFENADSSLELVYCLKKDYWQNHYMTEAVKLVLENHLEKNIKGKNMISKKGKVFVPKVIYASVMLENEGSIKILKKMGFVKQDEIEKRHNKKKFVYLKKI